MYSQYPYLWTWGTLEVFSEKISNKVTSAQLAVRRYFCYSNITGTRRQIIVYYIYLRCSACTTRPTYRVYPFVIIYMIVFFTNVLLQHTGYFCCGENIFMYYYVTYHIFHREAHVNCKCKKDMEWFVMYCCVESVSHLDFMLPRWGWLSAPPLCCIGYLFLLTWATYLWNGNPPRWKCRERTWSYIGHRAAPLVGGSWLCCEKKDLPIIKANKHNLMILNSQRILWSLTKEDR